MTECVICVEKFNKSNRMKIGCQYCESEACRECLTKWVLSDSVPRCMSNSCNKEWDRKFMASVFTGVFLNNDYKKHKEQILFEREQALLPATQPIVENMIRCDKINVEILEIEREISERYARANALRGQKYRLERGETAQTARSVFIKPCQDQNCRGFLSSQWKCGICEKWTCPDCHEIKGLIRDCEHVCNPDSVATAALISHDTKSCPSCGTGIHKLEGCDQMFCTMCHTGFSWKTGRIQTNVHNPHYFEWLRRTGGALDRAPNEVLCGREITHTLARNIFRDIRLDNQMTVSIDTANRATQICEAIIHLRHVVMDRYATDPVLNNQSLRIAYLRNKLTKDELKIRLQREDKNHQKRREIHNVFTMLVNTVTDIIYRFHNDVITKNGNGISTLSEVDQIVTYSNECFADISKIWGSKLIVINDKLRFVR